MDPRTGTIDMDMIATGRSAFDRESVDKLAEALKDFLPTFRGGPDRERKGVNGERKKGGSYRWRKGQLL
jgi:hypothetical protein